MPLEEHARPPTPLTLMHPTGEPRSIALMGSGPAAWMSREQGLAFDPGTADFLLITPGPGETDTAFTRRACSAAETVVHGGGVAYLAAPWRSRLRLVRRLSRINGVRLTPFLHVPNGRRPDFIVPAEGGPLRHVLNQAAVLPEAVRSTLQTALQLPFVPTGLARLPLATGYLVHASDHRPWKWIEDLSGERIAHIVTRVGWRSAGASIVLQVFTASDDTPAFVVKAARDVASARALEREAENLANLGAAASAAGFRVPTVVGQSAGRSHPAIVQSFVAGVPAAVRLRGRPGDVPELLRQLADRLLDWHHRSAVVRRIDIEFLESLISKPLQRVAGEMAGLESYSAELERAARSLQGIEGKFAAAHHDMTMRNVLVAPDGSLGLVDWEEAAPEALPLGDFFYAAVDAAHSALRVSRLDAVRECFAAEGRFTRDVARITAELAEGLALPPTLTALAYDACWLRHARNEANAVGSDDPRPFGDVLAWLAANRAQLSIGGFA